MRDTADYWYIFLLPRLTNGCDAASPSSEPQYAKAINQTLRRKSLIEHDLQVKQQKVQGDVVVSSRMSISRETGARSLAARDRAASLERIAC